MAGFFGFFDYTKPGPGVPKDAPPKPGIVVFFEIYSRKFWNLVKLNILFTIFNIPAIIAALYMAHIFIQKDITGQVLDDLMLKFMFGTIFLCIPVITVGPAQAGFSYVLRNYSREEHAFIWWDFKDNALKNFKESLIISIIDFIVILIVGIDINIYFTANNSNILMSLASGLLILAFVIYLMMHMYIYPMLVTFKLSIRQIFRNALIFAMMRFLPNLGILLLCVGILIATFWMPVIGFILLPLITLSTIGFITNFYVYPQLKKHMMDKIDSSREDKENIEKVAKDTH